MSENERKNTKEKKGKKREKNVFFERKVQFLSSLFYYKVQFLFLVKKCSRKKREKHKTLPMRENENILRLFYVKNRETKIVRFFFSFKTKFTFSSLFHHFISTVFPLTFTSFSLVFFHKTFFSFSIKFYVIYNIFLQTH